MRSLPVVVLCMLAAGQDLCAQAWQNAASRLRPGTRICVQKTDSTKLRGTVAAVGPDTVSIEGKGGAETIAVAGIRKVWVRRRGVRPYAPLIGAAAGAGAGALGAVARRPSMDFSGAGVALIAGIGAGAGALIGWVVRADAKDELVYDSAGNIGD